MPKYLDFKGLEHYNNIIQPGLIELIDNSPKNIFTFTPEYVKSIFDPTSQAWNGNTYTWNQTLSVTVGTDGKFTINGTSSTTLAMQIKLLEDITIPNNAIGSAFSNITLNDNICFALWGNVGLPNLILNDGVVIPNDLSNYSRGFVIRIQANTSCNNVIIKPMICTDADWKISKTYQPYRPTLDSAISNSEIDAMWSL